MTLFDDAWRKAQEIADAALSPPPPAPHPGALNPTLRVAQESTAGDRDPVVRNGKPDANGVITVELDPVDPGTVQLVHYIVVSTQNAAGTGTSANQTGCTVYDTYVDPGHIWDTAGTSGNGAVAAYQPPRRLPAGRKLIAQWTGANAGDVGVIRYEYAVEQAGG